MLIPLCTVQGKTPPHREDHHSQALQAPNPNPTAHTWETPSLLTVSEGSNEFPARDARPHSVYLMSHSRGTKLSPSAPFPAPPPGPPILVMAGAIPPACPDSVTSGSSLSPSLLSQGVLVSQVHSFSPFFATSLLVPVPTDSGGDEPRSLLTWVLHFSLTLLNCILHVTGRSHHAVTQGVTFQCFVLPAE